MKKQLLILLITILSFNTYAQISFEKGYFINNTDQKTDCFIKNIDWKNNPSEFQYKLSENGEPETTDIKSVKEFGILGKTKYNRFEVNIDRSSENINDMSAVKNPIFKEDVLFLKVLVEGKATLYYYENENLRRYFYKTDQSDIEQLIYKSYLTPENNVAKNNAFKQQLWLNLVCQSISLKSIENTDYEKNNLVDLFVKYNECSNSSFSLFEKKQHKDLFNLTLRPGLNSTSLSIQNSMVNYRDVDFGNKTGLRFGVEAEFIMPFNKNKWALIIEPTYQYFKSEKEIIYAQTLTITSKINVNVDYESIEIPFGIRYYSFLNPNSKLFFNASLIYDIPLSSTIYADRKQIIDLEINSQINLTYGLGYNYIDKYSLELRLGQAREILGKYTSWSSKYETVSLIFGFTIL
ncbi:MAG TPA: tRNA modification GTPase [Lutibacter sp.]